MKSTRYDVLVFDWDGTLADSIDRIVTSLQFASRTIMKTEIDAGSARDVIGLSLRTAIVRLHPELDSNEAIETVASAYSQHYLFDNPVPAPLFEGVVDMLHDLRARGYTLAVATGKSRRGLDRALDEHGLGPLFAATRCATEHRSKPDPEMLDDIVRTLGATHRRTLMVGDSEHDLQMALNAGIDAIGVTRGVHNEEVLGRHRPLACLDDVTDLPEFLNDNTDTPSAPLSQREIA